MGCGSQTRPAIMLDGGARCAPLRLAHIPARMPGALPFYSSRCSAAGTANCLARKRAFTRATRSMSSVVRSILFSRSGVKAVAMSSALGLHGTEDLLPLLPSVLSSGDAVDGVNESAPLWR